MGSQENLVGKPGWNKKRIPRKNLVGIGNLEEIFGSGGLIYLTSGWYRRERVVITPRPFPYRSTLGFQSELSDQIGSTKRDQCIRNGGSSVSTAVSPWFNLGIFMSVWTALCTVYIAVAKYPERTMHQSDLHWLAWHDGTSPVQYKLTFHSIHCRHNCAVLSVPTHNDDNQRNPENHPYDRNMSMSSSSLSNYNLNLWSRASHRYIYCNQGLLKESTMKIMNEINTPIIGYFDSRSMK